MRFALLERANGYILSHARQVAAELGIAGADAVTLLRRCTDALRRGGQVLTIGILRQDGNAPHRGKLADVMLPDLEVSGVLETPVGRSIVEARRR